MKTIIITAADETMSGLLVDLLQSLSQWRAPLCDAIGVLDVGLSATSRQRVQEMTGNVLVPGWDLDLDNGLREQKPYLRAITAKPFLRDYFPGYDTYIWLDADSWVQNAFAIEWLIRGARRHHLAVSAEIHPSYRQSHDVIAWRGQTLQRYFAADAEALLAINPYYNSGVIALRNDAPHWLSWARQFRRGLQSAPNLVTDQAALNFAIWTEQLPACPLPALCNWCCHLAFPTPSRTTGRFCEPHIPHQEIGIMHLTARTKLVKFHLNGDTSGHAFDFTYANSRLIRNVTIGKSRPEA